MRAPSRAIHRPAIVLVLLASAVMLLNPADASAVGPRASLSPALCELLAKTVPPRFLEQLCPSTPLGPGEFAITGDVENELVLSASSPEIQALPWVTADVTFQSGQNTVTRTVHGPLLLDVLNLAVPQFDNDVQNNHRLRFYITAVGSDGYAATIAWGEIDPSFGNKQTILAFEEAPTPSDPLVALEQPRVIGLDDQRGGRYVSLIVKILVQEAKP